MMVGGGRALLKPVVLARLIQAAELELTDRVLVVGCATGYSAAVLARIAGQVVALEEDGRLVSAAQAALAGQPNVTVVKGPLADGWSDGAPYDAILIDGAVEFVPDAFRSQLKDGGKLVCVLGVPPQPRPCCTGAAATNSAAGRFLTPRRRFCRVLPRRRFSRSKYLALF